MSSGRPHIPELTMMRSKFAVSGNSSTSCAFQMMRGTSSSLQRAHGNEALLVGDFDQDHAVDVGVLEGAPRLHGIRLVLEEPGIHHLAEWRELGFVALRDGAGLVPDVSRLVVAILQQRGDQKSDCELLRHDGHSFSSSGLRRILSEFHGSGNSGARGARGWRGAGTRGALARRHPPCTVRHADAQHAHAQAEDSGAQSPDNGVFAGM